MGNPADCVSRGIFPSELINHHLWWHGPEWLSKPQNEWPSQQTNYETDEEKKKPQIHVFHSGLIRQEDEYMESIMKKLSLITQMSKKIIIWIFKIYRWYSPTELAIKIS